MDRLAEYLAIAITKRLASLKKVDCKRKKYSALRLMGKEVKPAPKFHVHPLCMKRSNGSIALMSKGSVMLISPRKPSDNNFGFILWHVVLGTVPNGPGQIFSVKLPSDVNTHDAAVTGLVLKQLLSLNRGAKVYAPRPRVHQQYEVNLMQKPSCISHVYTAQYSSPVCVLMY